VKNTQLYPLKFNPILKEKIWGGNKLKSLFNKNAEGLIGESWELSGVNDAISLVADGSLEGRSLQELIQVFAADLVGEKVYAAYGDTFPLLFKFIDAAKDLSVQLHPDDLLAGKRHNSFGKTEMWYIMAAETDARLIIGFKPNTHKVSYKKALETNSILNRLISEEVQPGDSFFIAPGTVHAIGAGVVLAEIQQTSDITYRIFDWDRPGLDGNMRQLHTEEALEAINFETIEARINISEKENSAVTLKSTPYFETNKLVLTTNVSRNLIAKDSFVVYMCVAGFAEILTGEHKVSVTSGETVLIPKVLANLKIKTKSATLLEVYIP
jgi:mannose-6-phosphate isomerase